MKIKLKRKELSIEKAAKLTQDEERHKELMGRKEKHKKGEEIVCGLIIM